MKNGNYSVKYDNDQLHIKHFLINYQTSKRTRARGCGWGVWKKFSVRSNIIMSNYILNIWMFILRHPIKKKLSKGLWNRCLKKFSVLSNVVIINYILNIWIFIVRLAKELEQGVVDGCAKKQKQLFNIITWLSDFELFLKDHIWKNSIIM
jgi:hypothetical protein